MKLSMADRRALRASLDTWNYMKSQGETSFARPQGIQRRTLQRLADKGLVTFVRDVNWDWRPGTEWGRSKNTRPRLMSIWTFTAENVANLKALLRPAVDPGEHAEVMEGVLLEAGAHERLRELLNVFQSPVISKSYKASAAIAHLRVDGLIQDLRKAFGRSDRALWALRYAKAYYLVLILRSFNAEHDETTPPDTQHMDSDDTAAYELATKQIKKMSAASGLSPRTLYMYGRIILADVHKFRHFFQQLAEVVPELANYTIDGWAPPDMVLEECRLIEEKWKKEGGGSEVPPSDEDEVLIEFPDGFAWVNLNKPYCEVEGEAMGHCGNTGSPHDGDTVLSLRKKLPNGNWRPSLTFILNENTRMLGEMKGRGNDKPNPKYHPHIIALLKSDHVKGIVGGGYKPENNFSLDDLTDEQREDVLKDKPLLGGLWFAYKRDGMTDDLKTFAIESLENVNLRAEWDDGVGRFSLDNWSTFRRFLDSLSPNSRRGRDGVDAMRHAARVAVGDEPLDYPNASDYDIKKFVEDLPLSIETPIANYIRATEGEWVDANEELDDTELIKAALDEGLVPEVADAVSAAIANGWDSGISSSAEAQLAHKLSSDLTGSQVEGRLSLHLPHGYDGPAVLLGDVRAVDTLIREGDPDVYVDWADFLDTDFYPEFDDYDEDGAVESFRESMSEIIEKYKDWEPDDDPDGVSRKEEGVEALEQVIVEGAKNRYLGMFSFFTSDDVLNLTSFHASSIVDTQVPKIMGAFVKDDRIIWALRYLKAYLLHMLREHVESQMSKTAGVPDNRPAPGAFAMHQLELRHLKETVDRHVSKIEASSGRTLRDLFKDAAVVMRTPMWVHFFNQLAQTIPAVRDYKIEGWRSPQDVLVELRAIEKEWADKQAKVAPLEPGDRPIIEFPDGYAWVLLDREYCSAEGKAMGHCGNAGAPTEGDTILSLRSKSKKGGAWDVPHLTFIRHHNGELGEMKGRGNTKPKEKYHKYIKALLLHDGPTSIQRIVGGGYLPENNFSLDDLPEEDVLDILNKKPMLGGFGTAYRFGGATDEVIEGVYEAAEKALSKRGELDYNDNDETFTITTRAGALFKDMKNSGDSYLADKAASGLSWYLFSKGGIRAAARSWVSGEGHGLFRPWVARAVGNVAALVVQKIRGLRDPGVLVPLVVKSGRATYRVTPENWDLDGLLDVVRDMVMDAADGPFSRHRVAVPELHDAFMKAYSFDETIPQLNKLLRSFSGDDGVRVDFHLDDGLVQITYPFKEMAKVADRGDTKLSLSTGVIIKAEYQEPSTGIGVPKSFDANEVADYFFAILMGKAEELDHGGSGVSTLESVLVETKLTYLDIGHDRDYPVQLWGYNRSTGALDVWQSEYDIDDPNEEDGRGHDERYVIHGRTDPELGVVSFTWYEGRGGATKDEVRLARSLVNRRFRDLVIQEFPPTSYGFVPDVLEAVLLG